MRARAFAALAVGFATLSCYSPGEGIDPPGDRIYFPVGLALTAGASELLIANSDYDLQFNAGTLQLLDLQRLRARLPKQCSVQEDCCPPREDEEDPPPCGLACDNQGISGPPSYFCVADGGSPCGELGERSLGDQLLHPGRCESIELGSGSDGLLLDTVRIGAFATDVVYRAKPSGGGRVFVPVRGDATLHWADIDGGAIECGQRRRDGGCDDRHRAGNDEEDNTRGLRLDAEPFAIDASADGEVVLVTNQTSGRVALFQNDEAGGPSLEFTLADLPTRPVGVAALPVPALQARPDPGDEPYPQGFLVTYRNAPQVDLIRYFPDPNANPSRPFVSRAGGSGITLNSIGSDSRGIAVDGAARVSAELECDASSGVMANCARTAGCVDGLPDEQRATYLACLELAAVTPLDVYVANRAPPTLLVGRTVSALNAGLGTDLPSFYASLPLTAGPSRVVAGKVIVGGTTDELELEPRVFVVCFDSRRIFVYDPGRRNYELEITTGRGPHALAVDEQHGLLYVGHFTDSYLGVISIDRRFPNTYGKMIASVGEPSAPRASK